MAETPYHHYALYEPDAAPDLTASGEYNSAVMAIDADMHDEETGRKAADAELAAKIAAEATAREDADAALGTRIDNAETEISANSADLTGIKGLTYGEQHVHFVESDNGEYSSPALEEIAEQMGQGMTCVQIPLGATTVDTATLNKLDSDWPNVALLETGTGPLASGTSNNIQFPFRKDDSNYYFAPIGGQYNDEDEPYAQGFQIAKTGKVTRINIENDPYWSNVQLKPFSTIGPGLQVLDDTLTIDPHVLEAGITANTTWGELEAALIQ